MSEPAKMTVNAAPHFSAGQHGSGAYVHAIACVAACAGLLFGFDIAVINGAIVFLRAQFHLGDVQTEVAAGALLFGCIFGAAFAGALSDRYGRKLILIGAALLFAISSVAAGLPHSMPGFITARIAAGLATGIASVLAPLYISENSPPEIRGRLVTFNQMAIVSGILLAYLVNWAFSATGPNGWRWMFAAAAVPAIVLGCALVFVPESPRWLIKEGRNREALGILCRIVGTGRADQEFAEIRQAVSEESGSLMDLLRPGLRLPLLLSVGLCILQQITGVNTVLYYGALIFQQHAGQNSAANAFGLNVIIGLINFISTIVAILIIDKIGRKPLLMLSSAGMAISLTCLGYAFYVKTDSIVAILAIILCYVFSFGVGMGPGVWVVISELFPTRVRGRAMAVATVSLWIACLLLTSTYLTLVTAVGAGGAFWVYAGLSVIAFFFVLRWLPETKGRTLEEIERSWTKR